MQPKKFWQFVEQKESGVEPVKEEKPLQYKRFHQFLEEKDGGAQKCDGCGVVMDQGNPDRTLRMLEDPKGGLVGCFCPRCYASKQEQMSKQ